MAYIFGTGEYNEDGDPSYWVVAETFDRVRDLLAHPAPAGFILVTDRAVGAIQYLININHITSVREGK